MINLKTALIGVIIAVVVYGILSGLIYKTIKQFEHKINRDTQLQAIYNW